MCKKLLIVTSFMLMFGLASSALAIHASGNILFEYWFDIGGTGIGDLTGAAGYPDSPDDGELRPSFDGPLDWADNYGTRVRGWLFPAEDGDYTFWVAGDDFCDLILSTDDDPANGVVIAQVPGWTSYQQWDSYPEQQSAPITLTVAGGPYYIEGLMKEGGGGDSFTAGWAGPGIGEPNTITVIDGAYLAPADWSPSLLKAASPDPADGAVDVDVAILAWASGKKAVSHVVYLNDELLAETDQELAAADLAPGTSYTWRVDEIQEDGTVIEGSTWSFTTLPLEAHFPSPADGAEDVASPVNLSWTPGKNTILNQVYFGADEAAVTARDASTFKVSAIDASYNTGPLDLFSTYYWAVDAFTPTGTVAGPVWSLNTEKFVLIADEVTVDYDNSAEPYVSEVAIDTVADLTAEGAVSDLTLSFQGQGGNLSIDEDTGTYEVTGAGADVWGSADQFHYVYMNLTGDGEISARVVSNGSGSNSWAKGGVMVRQSTDPSSPHGIAAVTGGEGGGTTFQGRWIAGERSHSFHGDVEASPPSWVRLVREGNNLTAYYKLADGDDWALFTDGSPDGEITNPQPIEGLPDTVLIGLFVTSHAAGEPRTYTFDNVDIQGDVDGVIVSEDIDSVSGNSAESIYVALEDSTGAVAVVTHPYDAATQITTDRGWTIPLSAFEGADPTAAAKLIVGVGNGEPGGKGSVTVSDIRVVEPQPAGPKDVTVPGDIVQGVPNDGLMDGDDWGWPGAEHPALAVDDNTGTKFLHFRGDLMPTGIQVTPLDGPSIVNGLSLTTANDAPNRDPVTYELSGSNDGIDGPYTLIAAGDIVDFAGADAWPRFTKNATPITFANETAYAHYQLVFPDVRDPAGDNSMQIAEIELLEGVGILSWEAAAAADSPGYLATSVPLGVYDIGTYGGEQTYEFVVNANPDEEAVSMALIGRFSDAGGNRAALKFDQWNNTGEYGGTLFGVVDLYYGVAANYGVDTIATFVSSEAAGTTELYVDGELAGSVDRAVSLSGLVGIGGANRDLEGTGWVDPFDGDILGVAIYDGALSADQIKAHADAFFLVEAEAAPLLSVVRSGGNDGDRDPIGPYDGSTAPLSSEGGLMDGALVFSDRTYPWTGIPAEYVGTEYIRTFNSDKGADNVIYEVTLSRDAILWVTVDDRFDAPQGVADSVTAAIGPAGTFVDSGIDIYVRERDDGSRDRPLSVYAAELPAGTYSFGASEGNNFYVIGAIE